MSTRHNRLSAPTMAAWVIAVGLGVVGVLLHTHTIHLRLGVEDFWLVTAAFAILTVATVMRGL
jgi:hypothetical protein